MGKTGAAVATTAVVVAIAAFIFGFGCSKKSTTMYDDMARYGEVIELPYRVLDGNDYTFTTTKGDNVYVLHPWVFDTKIVGGTIMRSDIGTLDIRTDEGCHVIIIESLFKRNVYEIM